MRLQRFLARAGIASRRGSEALMTAGRVQVNGVVVRELGSKVDPVHDVVLVDGKPVSLSHEAAYIVLHKPAGYLTTMHDPYGRPCVAELIADVGEPGLFPVGRLDYDTTGLLLFTTDGDAGQHLLHPSHHIEKHYIALVHGLVQESDLEALRQGITLDDGPCQPAPCEVLHDIKDIAAVVACDSRDEIHDCGMAAHSSTNTRIEIPRGCSVVGITLREGRKHQVKRMLSAIGYDVIQLHRDSFGPLKLGTLRCGSWRTITSQERTALLHIIQKGEGSRWK